MDNLTHSLAGWALGQAGLKSTTRKGLAALILGANMPDVDVFFGPFPWEPLAMHRGFTHSLIGGVVTLPPVLFAFLWLLDRWQQSRGSTFKSGLAMRPWRLLGLCYLAVLTHPLLDLLTTYSVQLLTPFSGAWFHADALFIIDLWVWLLLGIAIFWSKWREKRGLQWRRPARAAIAILLAYVGVNLVISQRAYAAVRNSAGHSRVERLFASPPPIASWRRDLVWREGDCYRRARFTPFRPGLDRLSECEGTGLDDPAVRMLIAGNRSVQGFLRWSVMPQASVRRSRCTLRIEVSDARYGERGRSRLGRDYVVPTGAPGC